MSTEKTESTSLSDRVQQAIPLAITLIVGVFVALGIEGDVRARLIRNEPRWVSATFVLAILGVTLPILLSWGVKPKRQWPNFLAALILLVASGSAIITGVQGLGEREQPDVDVVVLDVSKSGTVALQFQATGLSLRSTDKMLLRVVALPSNTPKSQVLSECVRGVNGGADSDGTATVLFWGEAGPDAKGSVSTGITVEVPRSQYAYACGYAVLTAHGENVDAKSSRRLAAIIDLSTAYATHAVN